MPLKQNYWLNDAKVVDMDSRACNIWRISEESIREREKGWVMLQALQIAMISYDLSHLPSSMVRSSLSVVLQQGIFRTASRGFDSSLSGCL